MSDGNPFFYIGLGATTPTIDAALLNSGQPADLTGATVMFAFYRLGGAQIFERAATIVNASTGHVRYVWQAGDTGTEGRYLGRFTVTYPSTDVQFFPDDPRYIRVTIG